VTAAARAALVTGAASPIGQAMARLLAREGYALAIHCHRARERAEVLARTLAESTGVATAVLAADLTRETEVRPLLERAAHALAPVEVLVNNAALFLADPWDDLDPESWRRQIALNLHAPLLLALHFARTLPPEREGLIVNILDARILRPTPHYLGYTASKAGLWAATQVLAQRLAPRIRVNAIAPGIVEGDPNPRLARLVRESPLQRATTHAELEAALLFLLRARSMTGALLPLDGGRHLDGRSPSARAPSAG